MNITVAVLTSGGDSQGSSRRVFINHLKKVINCRLQNMKNVTFKIIKDILRFLIYDKFMKYLSIVFFFF